MCLAVPARIVERKSDLEAVADFGGVKRVIRLDLVPEAKEGDYVMVHVGYAIQIVDREEAERIRKLFEEMLEALGEAEHG